MRQIEKAAMRGTAAAVGLSQEIISRFTRLLSAAYRIASTLRATFVLNLC